MDGLINLTDEDFKIERRMVDLSKLYLTLPLGAESVKVTHIESGIYGNYTSETDKKALMQFITGEQEFKKWLLKNKTLSGELDKIKIVLKLKNYNVYYHIEKNYRPYFIETSTFTI